MRDYRIIVTKPAAGENGREWHTYITRRDGHINYFSGEQTPLALSNLVTTHAAELTFRLEDAEDATAACKIVQNLLKHIWRNNIAMCPNVTPFFS